MQNVVEQKVRLEQKKNRLIIHGKYCRFSTNKKYHEPSRVYSIFFFGKFILDTVSLFTLFFLDIVPNYSGTNDPGGLIFLYRTGLKTTRKRGA